MSVRKKRARMGKWVMEAGRNLLNSEARFANHLRRAPGRQQTNIVLDQTLGQVEQAGLVVDGDNG